MKYLSMLIVFLPLVVSASEVQSPRKTWVVKDPSYVPKVGDEAELANIFAGGFGGRESWLGVNCFVTINDYKKHHSTFSDPKYGWSKASLKESSDFFVVKPGTSVEILAKENIETQFRYQNELKKGKWLLFRVRIKDGGFKGQTVFVSFVDVCRLSETDKPPEEPKQAQFDDGSSLAGEELIEPKPVKKVAPPKMKARPRGDARSNVPSSNSNTKLELTDFAESPHKYDEMKVEIIGRIKNISDQSIPFIVVTLAIEDVNGKLVATEKGIVDPATLAAGETGTFSISTKKPSPTSQVKASFSSGGGENLPVSDLTQP